MTAPRAARAPARVRLSWLPMLLLAACAAPPAPDTDAPFQPTEDDPWTRPVAEPVYDVPTFEQIVGDALMAGVPDFGPLARAVTTLFDAGTSACPGEGYRDYVIAVYDPAGCYTEAGFWYEGAGAFALGFVDGDGDGVAEAYAGRLKMDMSAADPVGNQLEVGGDSTLEATLGEQGPAAIAGTLAGTYRWTADPGWLGRGVSVLLDYAVTYDPDVATIALDGGFTVPDQPSIGFDDLAFGGACGANPTGAVLARDGYGHWYRLDFDEGTCDGCGPLTFDLGTELGRACVDLTGPALGMAESIKGWTVERLQGEEQAP